MEAVRVSDRRLPPSFEKVAQLPNLHGERVRHIGPAAHRSFLLYIFPDRLTL
jgi:hypothetical protein